MPLPKPRPHSPLIRIGAPGLCFKKDTNEPSAASKAAIKPLPKFPINSRLLSSPKSAGASATPQGASIQGPGLQSQEEDSIRRKYVYEAKPLSSDFIFCVFILLCECD